CCYSPLRKENGMPFGSEGLQAGLGLALSGGGFRATLFHAGALLRLNQLGYLERLDRISSVSGGSITAGMLALKWDNLKSSNFRQDILVRQVVEPLKSFCKRNVDVPCIIKGLLVRWKGVSKYVAGQYSEGLYGHTTLQQLPDYPRFVFNCTNLATGVDFRFSKPYAGDYRIGLIRRPSFTLAEAVAASSAFPPVLSPAVLKPDPYSFERTNPTPTTISRLLSACLRHWVKCSRSPRTRRQGRSP